MRQGGQTFYVGGGGAYDDVDQEMHVSEANFLVRELNIFVRETSKLSAGAKKKFFWAGDPPQLRLWSDRLLELSCLLEEPSGNCQIPISYRICFRVCRSFFAKLSSRCSSS